MNALRDESPAAVTLWLRALARRMGAGAEVADDAAQDALLAWLRHPPQKPERLRPWLATVLRNRVREHARQERRRTRREHAAARADVEATTSEAFERRERWRAVIAAFRTLDRRTRRALWLRYMVGLPPRQIGAELSVPVATVKTRLRRGLARLRAQLRERWRPAWLLPWLPRREDRAILRPAAAVLLTGAALLAPTSTMSAPPSDAGSTTSVTEERAQDPLRKLIDGLRGRSVLTMTSMESHVIMNETLVLDPADARQLIEALLEGRGAGAKEDDSKEGDASPGP